MSININSFERLRIIIYTDNKVSGLVHGESVNSHASKQRSASDNTYFKNKDSITTITKPYITELSISLAGINIGQNSSRNQSSKVQEVGIHLHEYWPGSTATG